MLGGLSRGLLAVLGGVGGYLWGDQGVLTMEVPFGPLGAARLGNVGSVWSSVGGAEDGGPPRLGG